MKILNESSNNKVSPKNSKSNNEQFLSNEAENQSIRVAYLSKTCDNEAAQVKRFRRPRNAYTNKQINQESQPLREGVHLELSLGAEAC